ncbi:glycosyltransferase family 4 protein [Anaeromusa sp.]|uniref:glycosyltransferase family 4 protein n=1 Tax=Anaeromusa sp. TaxID=1872520 RepID=UPI002602ABC9|nr:glycosyltransferase family 4 protein [Anaeromusa sp.]MDD3158150.1 glycosyltransferase family 4 protein [Anaeromusa sp.]
MNNVKTLVYVDNFQLEGAAYSQFELTRWLRDNGILEPFVFAGHDGPVQKLYEEAGIPVFFSAFPDVLPQKGEKYEELLAELCSRITRQEIKVVYANTSKAFPAVRAAARCGIPSLWNIRDSEEGTVWPKQYGERLAQELWSSFSAAGAVVFVADATQRLFAKWQTKENYYTIHNGLDRKRLERNMAKWQRQSVRQSLGVAEAELLILSVGTVGERKGQLDLALAMEKLSGASAEQAHIVLVGAKDDAYGARVRAAREQLPEERRRRFHIIPETPEAAKYYTAADIFAFCSRNESFPRVILEAMACHLPIVTTPVHGVVEQVVEEENALFYQPGDIEALVRQLERLLGDAELRGKFTANSERVLGRLPNYSQMAQAYGALFLKLAGYEPLQ